MQNGAGHKYSRSYGFGVLNAEDLINAGKEWEHVGTQLKYTLRGLLTPDTATLPSKGEVELKVKMLFTELIDQFQVASHFYALTSSSLIANSSSMTTKTSKN